MFDEPPACSLEFDLTLSLLRRRVKRQARGDYEHTPEWEFLDQITGQLTTRFLTTTVRFFLLAVTEGDDGPESEWVAFDNLTADGVLPERVWHWIYDQIDKRCKAEDEERRKFQLPN